jgi:hypothetical protein
MHQLRLQNLLRQRLKVAGATFGSCFCDYKSKTCGSSDCCSFRLIWVQCLSSPFHHLQFTLCLFLETSLASAAHIRWAPRDFLLMFYSILSHVSSLMSAPTTPASSPQRNASASWKRKYELLETQFAAASKEPNATAKRQGIPSWRSTMLTKSPPLALQLGRYPWVEVSVAL